MIIYPEKLSIRDTDRPREIDDNDPEFLRDPTGLYAVYFGEEPVVLLTSTETEGHWDTIMSVRRVHFEKLASLLRDVLPQLTQRFE